MAGLGDELWQAGSDQSDMFFAEWLIRFCIIYSITVQISHISCALLVHTKQPTRPPPPSDPAIPHPADGADGTGNVTYVPQTRSGPHATA